MIKNFFSALLRFIYPPFCPFCRHAIADEYAVFCATCTTLIIPIVSAILPIYGEKKSTIFAVSDYQDPLRSLILAKHTMRPVAAKQMAYIMWQHLPLAQLDFDCIVTIPLHWTRYAYRGFNQSEIIAEYIAGMSQKPILSVLKRVRMTPLQASLKDVHERIKNVEDAFAVIDPNQIIGKHILLIDDLMTSGSTLRAAARLLYKSGAVRVDAAVLCRVL